MSRASLHPAVLAVQEHLYENAAHYYPQCSSGTTSVQCTRISERRFATLADFHLQCGTWQQRVLAKLTRSSTTGFATPSSVEHARFIAAPDRLGAEAAALVAYAQQVALQPDSSLIAVRVLDSIHDDHVLLMERVSCSPLTIALISASRIGQSRCSPRLLRLLENAGAALRTVHQMAPGTKRQRRGSTREDFLAWLDVMDEFFRGDAHGRRVYGQLAPCIRNAALQLLSETLPCGPQHYDFAPRNILVDERGRVAVIDMLDEWYGCVWEDVAHFLVSLEANKAQAFTGGWFFPRAALAEMRLAFLGGYAPDGQIDDHVIQLFEAQMALTKWAAALYRQRERSAMSKLVRHCPQTLLARCYANAATRKFVAVDSAIRRATPLTSTHLVAGRVS